MTTHVSPIHASQVIWLSVWILPSINPTIAATATKTALHTIWVDTALRLIERLSIPEPATDIQSTRGQWKDCLLHSCKEGNVHRQNMNQSTLRHSPKHQACSIVDSVHCAMTKFEFTDNVGRPCSYTGNSQRHRTHDTMPEVLKADGMERTPSPIWVFIMRAIIPRTLT